MPLLIFFVFEQEIPNSDRKMIERSTPIKRIHARSLSWFGSSTSIKIKWRDQASDMGPNIPLNKVSSFLHKKQICRTGMLYCNWLLEPSFVLHNLHIYFAFDLVRFLLSYILYGDPVINNNLLSRVISGN